MLHFTQAKQLQVLMAWALLVGNFISSVLTSKGYLLDFHLSKTQTDVKLTCSLKIQPQYPTRNAVTSAVAFTTAQ